MLSRGRLWHWSTRHSFDQRLRQNVDDWFSLLLVLLKKIINTFFGQYAIPVKFCSFNNKPKYFVATKCSKLVLYSNFFNFPQKVHIILDSFLCAYIYSCIHVYTKWIVILIVYPQITNVFGVKWWNEFVFDDDPGTVSTSGKILGLPSTATHLGWVDTQDVGEKVQLVGWRRWCTPSSKPVLWWCERIRTGFLRCPIYLEQ